MSPLRIGIVGVGSMGRTHLAALSGMPSVAVRSLCDPDTARVKDAAQAFGVEHYTDDLMETLAQDLDAVVVATPEHAHLEPVVTALRSGKHVLVEKPFATDPVEARQMAAEAQLAGLVLMPGHLLRYEPRHRMIKDWIASGDHGTLTSLYFRRNRPRSLFGTYSRVHPGFELSSHDLDLALWFTGRRVRRVYALHRQRTPDPNPYGFWSLIEFESDTVATFEAVWSTVDQARVEFADLCEVIAEGGSAHLDISNPGLSFWDSEGQTRPDPIYGGTPGDVPLAVKAELEDFVECVSGRRLLPRASLDDAVHGVEVIDAMIQSARSAEPRLV